MTAPPTRGGGEPDGSAKQGAAGIVRPRRHVNTLSNSLAIAFPSTFPDFRVKSLEPILKQSASLVEGARG